MYQLQKKYQKIETSYKKSHFHKLSVGFKIRYLAAKSNPIDYLSLKKN